jgi:hypothetical protein
VRFEKVVKYGQVRNRDFCSLECSFAGEYYENIIILMICILAGVLFLFGESPYLKPYIITRPMGLVCLVSGISMIWFVNRSIKARREIIRGSRKGQVV